MLAQAATKPSEARASIFAGELADMSDQRLLEHFRTRQRPHLFVVEEPEETTPGKIAAIMDGVFAFNGETHALGLELNWLKNPSPDQEWHILLHKFYYGVGLARAYEATEDRAYLDRWVGLTASWLDQHVPADFIAADVTGRRLQNWVYAWSIYVRSPHMPARFHRDFLTSVHAQTTRLLQILHKGRNHRTLELHAIFLVAVAFPEFADAPHWLAFALTQLEANAAADFQADGAHCEQSPHYHCIVLRNFLNVVRLARLNDVTLGEELLQTLRRALNFAAWMHRPDGAIPALSDADGGAYGTMLRDGAVLLNCLDGLRRNQAKRSALFAESGYVVLRSAADAPGERPEDRRFLVLDAGPLGQGNHGHLDALSIEVYAHGKPIIVDPGRYTYSELGEINWRAKFRCTAAHSTVQVDNLDQARYEPAGRKWKITGPPARSTVLAFASQEHADYVHGQTISAEYAALHTRRVFFVEGHYWLIVDTLQDAAPHRYDLRFQLTPDTRGLVALAGAGRSWRADTAHALISCRSTHETSAAIEQGWVSRRYGEKQEAPRLRFSADAENCTFATLITPRHGAALCFSRLEQDSRGILVHVAHAESGAEDVLSFDCDGGAEIVRTTPDRKVRSLLRVQGRPG